jgi:hypothetical protein
MTGQTIQAPPEVPAAAWAFAWSCLAGQALSLLVSGRDESNDLLLSMLLGIVVIGWVSHGVLTARVVRVGFVWVMFVIALLFQVLGMFDSPSGGLLADLVLTVIQFVLFIRFTDTEYFRWQRQRSRPGQPGPSLAGLMAIAILVGALGGVVGTHNDGVRVESNF